MLIFIFRSATLTSWMRWRRSAEWRRTFNFNYDVLCNATLRIINVLCMMHDVKLFCTLFGTKSAHHVSNGLFTFGWFPFPHCLPLAPFYTGRSNSLLPQWGDIGKREFTKNEWDTGVFVLGAFNLDHLQPVELILSPNFSNFLIFVLGAPISYNPLEGKRRKRDSPKNEWDTGVSVHGAFKLDHLQPVERQ